MTAAIGMDAVAWCDQFGAIPPKEVVHHFVVWLLADLFDSLVQQSGATDRLSYAMNPRRRRGVGSIMLLPGRLLLLRRFRGGLVRCGSWCRRGGPGARSG
ncbi:hypothetical protein ACWGII_41165 [Streptomyces sp. NPDC054855]